MKPLKLSIITPTLNMGQYLEQAIQGIISQNYSNCEHIVIDGGSKDGTIEILKKYPHIKWISEPDRGLSDALNKGINMAKGGIIGWCNADDYYLPGAFKTAIETFQNDPSLMFLYGDYRNIDIEGRPIKIRREINFDLFILKYLHVNYIVTPASFWRKNLHDSGLMFNENLYYSMDSDFILRSALAGHRFQHVPILICDFRIHPETKSANPKQHEEYEMTRFWHVPLLRRMPPSLSTILRKTLLVVARVKRTIIRLSRGHYIDQWWRC